MLKRATSRDRGSVIWRVYTAVATVSILLVRAQTPTGHISGTVVDELKQPVAKAFVSVNIRAKPGTAFRTFSANATTVANGAFVVTGVPAGTFEVCVQSPGTTLLPTCTWQAAPSVTLVSGASAVLPPITMVKGVHVPIVLNDPRGFIASKAGVSGASYSVRAAAAYGPPVPASLVSSSPTGYVLDLLVPFATPVKLAIFSAAYLLADATGRAISLGSTYPVTVATGALAPQMTFTVTGINPLFAGGTIFVPTTTGAVAVRLKN